MGKWIAGLRWVNGVWLVLASGMGELGWVSGGVGLVWASGGIRLGWVDEGIGVVEIFEAEIKNEILITRGQSHIATRGYFS